MFDGPFVSGGDLLTDGVCFVDVRNRIRTMRDASMFLELHGPPFGVARGCVIFLGTRQVNQFNPSRDGYLLSIFPVVGFQSVPQTQFKPLGIDSPLIST